MRRGPPPGIRWRASGRRVGVSRWGVWPAPSTISRRAPGMPAAIASARPRPTGSRAPAMTSVGRVDAAEAVVERLHRALSGAAQARGETGRAVAQAIGVEPGAARGRHRGVAGEDRLALPFGDEGLDPVALEPRRRAPRRRRAGRRARPVGDPGGRALEDEPADRRSGARRPGGGRSGRRASSRGHGPAPPWTRRRIVAEVVGGSLDAGPARVVRDAGSAVTGQVDDDRRGTVGRTPSHGRPSPTRDR